MDGSCGRKLWTKVVDGSCGRKLWTEVISDATYHPFGLINCSFSIKIDPMGIKMKRKYAKEYSNLKKWDITVLKATK